jgi:hypothetical protein
MSIEAMKLALDALEQHGTPLLNHEDSYSASLTALRQAIEAAEKQVSYSGNGTAGRENMTAPTGFFFQMPKAEKQEPVAWVQDVEFEQLPEFAFSWVKTRLHDKPLYTHPPKREWKSLTDDQIKEIVGPYGGPIKGYTRALFDKIDAKLRENNKC